MTARRATFKQSDLTRALRAAKAAGLNPCGYRIDPNTGEIEVQIGNGSTPTGNSFDRLMGARHG